MSEKLPSVLWAKWLSNYLLGEKNYGNLSSHFAEEVTLVLSCEIPFTPLRRQMVYKIFSCCSRRKSVFPKMCSLCVEIPSLTHPGDGEYKELQLYPSLFCAFKAFLRDSDL